MDPALMSTATGLAHTATSPAPAFTRFIFVVPREDDDTFRSRLRAAGAALARGFFNDFDAEAGREVPQEAIQFLVAEGGRHPDSAIAAAIAAVLVTGKYRPRLAAVEADLRRRIGEGAGLHAIEGVERPLRYTSLELHEFAYRRAAPRQPGRVATHAIVLPVRKTAAWWALPPLERQTFFYPHVDERTGCRVPGHALAAEAGIGTLFRRLYHNPDGYGRPGEPDFIAYFECPETHLDTFARVHGALRDTSQNPEWRYVEEGPVWVGRRVLRW